MECLKYNSGTPLDKAIALEYNSYGCIEICEPPKQGGAYRDIRTIIDRTVVLDLSSKRLGGIISDKYLNRTLILIAFKLVKVTFDKQIDRVITLDNFIIFLLCIKYRLVRVISGRSFDRVILWRDKVYGFRFRFVRLIPGKPLDRALVLEWTIYGIERFIRVTSDTPLDRVILWRVFI